MADAANTDADRTHRGSHYVDIASTPWQPTPSGEGRMKVLMGDLATGPATVMFDMPPGGVVKFHEHPDLEQTYMLSGSLVDEQGECTAGNFVWREAGSRHEAHSPNGCVFIAFFMKFSRKIGT